jgi:ribosomal protein S18 acetylase RimI-like enzyme
MTKPRSGEVLIRPATDADFEALVELDLASARHHAELDPVLLQLPDREPVATFLARRLTNPDRRILVAVVDGRVVGMVDVTMVDPPQDGSIYRSVPTADLGISVIERYRGRGVGQALMVAAEHDARSRGARRIVLDVLAANAGARRFYERLGYREHSLVLGRDLATDP